MPQHVVDSGYSPVLYFIDTLTVILLTRFILNLRSFDLPRSNVPGDNTTHDVNLAWSSRLNFANRIKTIDIVGNIGAPLVLAGPEDACDENDLFIEEDVVDLRNMMETSESVGSSSQPFSV
ncbi:hypothetical protein NLI96_g11428 [Meripilus lineatus]|uniref:Uncharacterized protein n=1 Tax=Meripilus lineatus TaxID=2056292 RepID=A0AAD5YDE2_9APHY|nr:hypothetical protein NLI96_g11428 [Physisporinus lineatus]